jgi:hypothetical protein
VSAGGARRSSSRRSGSIQSARIRITIAEMIGTATKSPRKPTTWPTTTTPITIIAGCSDT